MINFWIPFRMSRTGKNIILASQQHQNSGKLQVHESSWAPQRAQVPGQSTPQKSNERGTHQGKMPHKHQLPWGRQTHLGLNELVGAECGAPAVGVGVRAIGRLHILLCTTPIYTTTERRKMREKGEEDKEVGEGKEGEDNKEEHRRLVSMLRKSLSWHMLQRREQSIQERQRTPPGASPYLH